MARYTEGVMQAVPARGRETLFERRPCLGQDAHRAQALRARPHASAAAADEYSTQLRKSKGPPHLWCPGSAVPQNLCDAVRETGATGENLLG